LKLFSILLFCTTQKEEKKGKKKESLPKSQFSRILQDFYSEFGAPLKDLTPSRRILSPALLPDQSLAILLTADNTSNTQLAIRPTNFCFCSDKRRSDSVALTTRVSIGADTSLRRRVGALPQIGTPPSSFLDNGSPLFWTSHSNSVG
jgi:hypothetical protein